MKKLLKDKATASELCGPREGKLPIHTRAPPQLWFSLYGLKDCSCACKDDPDISTDLATGMAQHFSLLEKRSGWAHTHYAASKPTTFTIQGQACLSSLASWWEYCMGVWEVFFIHKGKGKSCLCVAGSECSLLCLLLLFFYCAWYPDASGHQLDL